MDFYDHHGFLLRTDRFPAHRTATDDDVINPGTTAVLKVTKPATAKTYRVWSLIYLGFHSRASFCASSI